MARIDAVKVWSLNYRLITSIITSVAPEVAELKIEVKELFVLAEIDEHPHPAELATRLSMPKPSVTVYLKHLEAGGLIRREFEPTDLRRHRILVTPAGRRVMTRGLALLSSAFGARLARLTAAEQRELKTLVEKMI
jgi:DNA-binding MarR family transcriptional regulator